MSLLEFIANQNSKSDLGNLAQQTFGESNPFLAQLAKADPDSFRQLLPSIIGQQMQQSALSQLAGGQPTAQPQQAQSPYGVSGDSSPNAAIPQGLPQQDVQQAMPQAQPAAPQQPSQQSALAMLPMLVRASGGNMAQGISALKEIRSLQVPPGMGAIPQGQQYVDGHLQTVPGAMTEGQKDRDKDFADIYTPFKMTGGMQNQKTQIDGIQQIIDKLQSGDVNTGTGSLAPFSLDHEGDAGMVGRIANNSFLQANNQIMKAVLPSSKAMFGSRVTQKEVAMNLMANGLNPYATNEENIANLTTLKNNLMNANQKTAAAGQYFDQHGTLAGYQGDVAGMTAAPTQQAQPSAPQSALSQVSQQQSPTSGGQIYVNPQTGQRITKMNGKWVPVQ